MSAPGSVVPADRSGAMSSGLQLRGLVVGSGGSYDLDAPPGTVVAVVGPSGGDRQGLLRAAAGLDRPRSGSVLLDGAEIDPVAAGVVDEDHTLLGDLSAAENVATRLLARGPISDEDWSGASELLASVGLPEPSWHNLVEQLSGGQQQRVAVARALAAAPRLLSLDDPLSELDGASAELVWTRIEAAAATGAVVLVGLPALEPPVRADVVLAAGG